MERPTWHTVFPQFASLSQCVGDSGLISLTADDPKVDGTDSFIICVKRSATVFFLLQHHKRWVSTQLQWWPHTPKCSSTPPQPSSYDPMNPIQTPHHRPFNPKPHSHTNTSPLNRLVKSGLGSRDPAQKKLASKQLRDLVPDVLGEIKAGDHGDSLSPNHHHF